MGRMSALIYVVGPSGAGKDTLLAYARSRLAGQPVCFAHRYITRPAEAGGENHVALAQPEFDARLGLGLFAMHWASHSHRYAIGAETHAWLQAGAAVVVNGSREQIPLAAATFPSLAVVAITVRPELLRQRLLERGREPAEQIEARLRRAAQFSVEHPGSHSIDNSGPIPEAGEALVALVQRLARQSSRNRCPAPLASRAAALA